MNFFGHAVLAAERDPDPCFVFGAMLPDFMNMAGIRSFEVIDCRIARGIRFHHTVDDAFHGAASVRQLMARARRELIELSVPKGPARAVAHVGVELMLDGALAEHAEDKQAYLAALNADRELPGILWDNPGDCSKMLRLLERLTADHGSGILTDDPARLLARLRVVLAPRPRLALTDPHIPAVKAWLRESTAIVRDKKPTILAEVRARLAAAGGQSERAQSV